MLTSSKQMIIDAQRGGYAVGCFNTSDLEITKAIIAAAEAQRAPAIVATSEKAIQYGGLESLAALIKQEAENVSVPVALHLDHGKTISIVERCLAAGYTSVMIDGAELPLSENADLTLRAVEIAHRREVPCEGEIGFLGKAGQNEGRMTNPDDVGGFVEKTKVDFLAVAIGSAHGVAASEALNIGLLKKIREITNIPLVLHGGSGVPDKDIRQAISNGISKINIDTDIRNEFTRDLREALARHPEEHDPREIMVEVMAGVQKLVESKIRLFGANNKC